MRQSNSRGTVVASARVMPEDLDRLHQLADSRDSTPSRMLGRFLREGLDRMGA